MADGQTDDPLVPGDLSADNQDTTTADSLLTIEPDEASTGTGGTPVDDSADGGTNTGTTSNGSNNLPSTSPSDGSQNQTDPALKPALTSDSTDASSGDPSASQNDGTINQVLNNLDSEAQTAQTNADTGTADPEGQGLGGTVAGNDSGNAQTTNTEDLTFLTPGNVTTDGVQTQAATSQQGPQFTIAGAQLTAADVDQLLARATAVTPSNDAIIAIVDRNGRILGVRTEIGVNPAILGNPALLAFAIDGAVAKARTAAFFSNGDPTNPTGPFADGIGTLAPLTSRLIGFLSGSTITQREVQSNPNDPDPNSIIRGPGLVAPVGIGGHFPPGVPRTPPVDLFAIEKTNRDSLLHPGPDGIKGNADDVALANRFNIAALAAGAQLFAPESFGGPTMQTRGIATLPGGIPIFRDMNGDGVGETLIGGIGVFFPGPDGTADFEQGFVPGIGQTREQRINAPKVLEAEFIALATVGSNGLAALGIPTLKQPFGGVAPIDDIDMPFGRLDLVGINLQVLGPIAGRQGAKQLVNFGQNLGPGVVNGVLRQASLPGLVVSEGFLVNPTDSPTDPNLTANVVRQIIEQGIAEARRVRAAIRLRSNGRSSARTRMVLAVADRDGNVLGLFRMQDATIFSIDVAVAKARNTAYYADAGELNPADQVQGVPPGAALTNRTFRFLAEPRFPSGVDGTPPPPFSILNDGNINPFTAENNGAPAPANAFVSVAGFDAFNPGTNFRDAASAAVGNSNGIVFFPGSTPIYTANGVLIGGFGVSGDGVDQDDVVTFSGSQGFLPPRNVLRADETFVRGVRLPFQKFLRNPHG